MIRAVLWDLDGVLFEGRPIHRAALDTALAAHGCEPVGDSPFGRIALEGLPTAVKLARLVELGRVRQEDVTSIAALKQRETRRLIERDVKFDPGVYCLIAGLAQYHVALAVVSNAIRDTVDLVLRRLVGPAMTAYFFDAIVTPENGRKPKPDPEMYRVAAAIFTEDPSECLAVEDNEKGVRSATEAGCRVLRVSGPDEVTPKRIWEALC